MKLLMILLVLSLSLQAKNERYYQKLFCDKVGGKIEYRLPDYTRIDCLTRTHAIEVKYPREYLDALGQSIHYSIMTNKKAGIYLIIKKKSDFKYLRRLKRIAKKHRIDIFDKDGNKI